MKLTYLGQGGFAIETGDHHLVVDPFISPNPLAKDLDVNKVKADYILLTHGHQDHVADVETIAERTGAKIISNFEIVSYYENKGIGGHPMNHGGKWRFDFGLLRYVNAIHSSVLPDGTYGGNPGGFVINTGEKNFYIAGDTALTMDMKLIPMLCGPLDFAIFPIGDNFTMGYEDAVIASDFVQCNNIIGCHYDTFGYIEIDHKMATSAFEKASKKLTLPEIGVPFEL
jgi:L-ascorbate metabolism protein UlaG (beta-lactamase superfamily)